MAPPASQQEIIPSALRCWFGQTYRNKELIILSEDDLSAIIPDHPRIRVVKCGPNLTIGRKRNIGAENSRGAFITHWDQDDWSYPDLLQERIAGFNRHIIQVVAYEHGCLPHDEPGSARRTPGSPCPSLTYRRTFWMHNKFREDIPDGEDGIFIRRAPPAAMNLIGGRTTKTLSNSYPKHKIVLALLSWNRADVVIENLDALIREAWRLSCIGHQALVVACDNGSHDGTSDRLKEQQDVHLILNEKNLGSAVGRNQMIDYAVEVEADYILFVDCDITVIPGSVMEMLKWFAGHRAASLGANPYLFTDDPSKATRWCPPIAQVEVSPNLALTQYGLFPLPVLRECRFDEGFGPGWGCEDDDLAIQIQDKLGLQNFTFDHCRYVHRHAHGSISLMQDAGMDVDKNIRERYVHLVNKWKDNPKFTDTITEYGKRTELPEFWPKTTMPVNKDRIADDRSTALGVCS